MSVANRCGSYVMITVPKAQYQPGHIRPSAPADLVVFDQSETEGEAPVAIPAQVAKVLGEV